MRRIVHPFALLASLLAMPAVSIAAEDVDFETEIRPILEDRCITCHGAERQKGALRLDRPDGVFPDHEDEWLIRPGEPLQSPLFQRLILPADDLDIMPADGEPLDEDQIALLRAWIEQGAEWPRDASAVDFHADVWPILEARCIKCHGPERQQGKLRLDTHEHLLAGADGRAVIEPGDAEASEFFKRIILPADDLDIMPADGEPLAEDEVAIIRAWIDAGAEWPEGGAHHVVAAPPPPLVVGEVDDDARVAIAAARSAITERGGLALRVAENTEAIDVNLSLMRDAATDADLSLLDGLEPVLVWLDLARSDVSDEGLRHLAAFSELRRIRIQETSIGDAGLAHLLGLEKLESLNLYATQVSDDGVARLAELPNLTRLYLWQTEVSNDAIAALREARPDLVVDRGWEPEDAEPIAVDFNRDVRPILANNCFSCHGPDEATRKAGLRLDTLEGALATLRSGGAAVVPGDPSKSLLITRAEHGDENMRMPPANAGRRLSRAEIDILRRWIEDGATWAEHWSFVPPRRPSPPAAGDGFAINAIDRFVAAQHGPLGLRPSAPADRYTLARRLSLDIRGVPPTVEEVDAFIADTEPGAFERLVDRFLADEAWGERWAAVWLDLARYADTKGYEKDSRRTIWPYRDWVIRALNEDLPFDRFTLEQIAGDLLADADDDALVATAFHRNTMTNDEGGTDDEEFRVAAVVDRVNTTMEVWMGLTAACAQCHTHKFDPITIDEYYGLFALLNQTADRDRPNEAPVHPVASPEQREQLASLDTAAARAASAVAEREAGVETELAAWVESLRATTAPSADGLVVHEPLDDAASLDGPAAAASGVLGGAARLQDAPVRLGGHGDFERDQPFSYAVWMKLDGGGVHVPISRMDVGNDFRGWDIYVHDGNLVVHVIHRWPQDCVRIQVTEKIPYKVWTHVAVTWDGSGKGAGLGVYVNGRRALGNLSNDTLTASIRTEAPLILGGRTGANTFRGELDDVRVYERALSDDEVHTLALHGAANADDAALHRAMAMADDDELRALRTAHAAAKKDADTLRNSFPRIPVMQELPLEEQRMTHVHVRGNFLDLGPTVEPGVPETLHDLRADARPNRLDFARWLVARENPLTARVQVNRMWEQIFGMGLVETTEDFGTQGAMPTHPALLDWLAVEFMENGWSLKQLCKTIVMSATYRQSSVHRADAAELDPDNRLYWRGPRRRLSAEMVRDQALEVAGLLSDTMYGPPVFPPQPDGVWQIVYSGDRWNEAEGDDRWRRGLYTFWRRTSPYPSMVTFDAPSREFCVTRRIRTNTPLQALVTLNDPVYVEAAQAFARRVMRDGGDRPIATAFRWATGRPARPEEIEAVASLLESERAHYRANDAAAVQMATQPLGPAPDGADVVELAAWTVVGNVLLNLDEVLVKG